jgi:hypothetical protein
MRSKLVLTVAAGLLAGTIAASAQQSGGPAGDRDKSGQATDSGVTSTTPNRQGANPQGTVGSGAVQKKNGPAMKDHTPLQPGGISPSAPPQSSEGQDAQPRPR